MPMEGNSSGSLDDTAKKRLMEMQIFNDPVKFKAEQEKRYYAMQKKRRNDIINLARESSMQSASQEKNENVMQEILEEDTKEYFIKDFLAYEKILEKYKLQGHFMLQN